MSKCMAQPVAGSHQSPAFGISGREFAVSESAQDPVVQSLLNQSLRQQLMALASEPMSATERQLALRESFVAIAEAILLKTDLGYAQRVALHDKAYEQAMLSMQEAKLAEAIATRQFVHASGLVLSPIHCSTTIKDVSRLDAFGTGMDVLIRQQCELARQQGRDCIHILYPACGPFAPLLLPLLTYYQANDCFPAALGVQLKVTLVDIHEGATQTLRQLVADLGLEEQVETIATADACSYTPSSPIDVLVLEASQHGFSKEAHFSIAHGLLPHLRDSGELVPKEVVIKAAMVVGQTEYVEQFRNANTDASANAEQPLQLDAAAQADRVELGEVWRLNKASIAGAKLLTLQDGQQLVLCNRLTLPEERDDLANRILVLYSEFDTFGDGKLTQYQSGITHPLPMMEVCVDFKPNGVMPDDLLLSRGDTMEFYYRLNGLTGFLPVKVG